MAYVQQYLSSIPYPNFGPGDKCDMSKRTKDLLPITPTDGPGMKGPARARIRRISHGMVHAGGPIRGRDKKSGQ
jgi:hypothetical protein